MVRLHFTIAKLLADTAELDRWALVEYLVAERSSTIDDYARWNAMSATQRAPYRQRVIDRVCKSAQAGHTQNVTEQL